DGADPPGWEAIVLVPRSHRVVSQRAVCGSRITETRETGQSCDNEHQPTSRVSVRAEYGGACNGHRSPSVIRRRSVGRRGAILSAAARSSQIAPTVCAERDT